MDGLLDGLIRTIQDAVKGSRVDIDGKEYVTKQVFLPPALPQIETLTVHTLQGIVDFLKADIDELDLNQLAVHVETPSVVSVIRRIERRDNQRETHLKAVYESPFSKGFQFQNFIDREVFNIAMQSLVVASDRRDELLRLIGNMKEQKVAEFSDDGMSQEVLTRKGRGGVGEVDIQNPFVLAPMRTFTEVVQPESPFILRIKSGDAEAVPKCALFEADGGAWKVAAIRSIKQWLTEALDGAAMGVEIIA